MSKRTISGRRGLAFLLAMVVLLGSVNVNEVAAAVRDWTEVMNQVDISHSLNEDGMAAEIVVTEGSPDIRITGVKMVGGETVSASEANAELSTPTQYVSGGGGGHYIALMQRIAVTL